MDDAAVWKLQPFSGSFQMRAAMKHKHPIYINSHKPEQLIEQIEYMAIENPVRDRIVTTAEATVYIVQQETMQWKD